VPHISTGDMFRAAVKSRSELGEKAKQYMDTGELVPDEVVMGLVAERLGLDDTKARGFVLDGFPRTVHQAKGLAELLAPDEIDLVVNLEVPTEVVLRRLAGRRVCVDCGANYSVDSPPRLNWTCDICGGEVVQREDDTEGAIRRRLDLYERETRPLVDWYSERDLLAEVTGVGDPDEISGSLVRVVDQRREHSLGRRV
jgi:adenylate kinase